MENNKLNTTLEQLTGAISKRDKLLEAMNMPSDTEALSYLSNEDLTNLAIVETLIKTYVGALFPYEDKKFKQIFSEYETYNNQNITNLVTARNALLHKLNLDKETLPFSYIEDDNIVNLLMLEVVTKTFAKDFFNEDLSFEDIRTRCLEGNNKVTR